LILAAFAAVIFWLFDKQVCSLRYAPGDEKGLKPGRTSGPPVHLLFAGAPQLAVGSLIQRMRAEGEKTDLSVC
jgi:hypothetical protein